MVTELAHVSLLTPLLSPVVNTQQILPSITLTPGVVLHVMYFTRPGWAPAEQEKALTVARFDLKFKNITLSMRLCLVNLSRCLEKCPPLWFYHRCTESTISATFGRIGFAVCSSSARATRRGDVSCH